MSPRFIKTEGNADDSKSTLGRRALSELMRGSSLKTISISAEAKEGEERLQP